MIRTRGTIKLNKEFWPDILAGKKTNEYRKATKAYSMGWYTVIDMETGAELGEMHLAVKDIYFNKDYTMVEPHRPTLEFVEKNYVGKHTFVQYKISSPISAKRSGKTDEHKKRVKNLNALNKALGLPEVK